MRRPLSLLLALALLASFLAGCGPQPTPEKVVVKETVPVPVKETVVVPATAAPGSSQATGGGPVTLEVYDPTGAIEVTQLFAPRVKDLNGCTICEVSDDLWETDRTFPVIRELLQKQFPTAKIITYDKFPKGSDALLADAKLGDKLKEAGCQAAIVGNAG